MTIPIIVQGDIPQGNSRDLEFQLQYDPDTPLVLSNIQTATMSLYLHDYDGAIINNRTEVDVKGSISSAGFFSHPLSAEDNQMQCVGERIEKEIHVAVITIVATGVNGDETLKRSLFITIVNQQHVANAMSVNPITAFASAVDPTVVIT